MKRRKFSLYLMVILLLLMTGCKENTSELSLFKNKNGYILHEYNLKQPGSLSQVSFPMLDYTQISDDSVLSKALLTSRGIIPNENGMYSQDIPEDGQIGSSDKVQQANKLWGLPWTGNATISKTFGMQVDNSMSSDMTVINAGELLAIGVGEVISQSGNEIIVKYGKEQRLSYDDYSEIRKDLDKIIHDSNVAKSNWRSNAEIKKVYYNLVENTKLQPAIIRAQNEQAMFNLTDYYKRTKSYLVGMENKLTVQAAIMTEYMCNRFPYGWSTGASSGGIRGGSPDLSSYSASNRMSAEQLKNWALQPNIIWSSGSSASYLFSKSMNYFEANDLSSVSFPTESECNLSGDALLTVPFFRHSINLILSGEIGLSGDIDDLTYDMYTKLNPGDSNTYSWGIMQFNGAGGQAGVVWNRVRELIDPNTIDMNTGSTKITYVKYKVENGKIEVSAGSKLNKGDVIASSVVKVSIGSVILDELTALSPSSWVAASPSVSSPVDFIYGVLVIGDSKVWKNLYQTTLVVDTTYANNYSTASYAVKTANKGRCISPDMWNVS